MKKVARITEIPESVKTLEQCPALKILMKDFSKKI